MIYLKLFYTFFKIGLFTFGGGYAMIPIVRDTVVNNAWLTDSEFLNFLAVCESTPGPIAINMATFVGSSQGGLIGAVLSTLGVVLPSFIIIFIIAALISNLLKYAGVNAFLCGIRPCVVGLIISAALTLGAKTLLGFSGLQGEFQVSIRGIIIFAIIAAIAFIYKKIRGKKISPILLIVLSAGMGILAYGL